MAFIRVSSILSILVLLGYYSCNNLFVTQQQRKVASFNSIRTSGIMNVFIQQGDSESVRVKTDDDIINTVSTEVNNGELLITNAAGIRGERVTDAYVIFKKIDSIHAGGASTLTTRGLVHASRMKVSVSGAAELKLQVESDSLWLIMEGNANVQLAGSSSYFNFKILKVGDLMAYNFSTKHTVANMTTGDQSPGIARINTSDLLDVTIIGPRHLYYLGDPKIVRRTIEGGGKVKRK